MKRFLTIMGILFAAIILGIILLNDNKLKISDVSEVEKAIENEETFALVIGQSSCNACKIYYSTTLKDYYKNDYDVPIYVLYVDISFENIEQFNKFTNKYNLEIDATPTTYFVKDGKFTDITGEEGTMTLTELYDYIKEQNK